MEMDLEEAGIWLQTAPWEGGAVAADWCPLNPLLADISQPLAHNSVYRNTKLAKIALLADTLLTKLTLAILCIRPDGVMKHLFIYHL